MTKTPDAGRVQSLCAEYGIDRPTRDDLTAGDRFGRLGRAVRDAQEKLLRNQLLTETGVQFSADATAKLERETDRTEQFIADATAALELGAKFNGVDLQKSTMTLGSDGMPGFTPASPAPAGNPGETYGVQTALAKFSQLVTGHQLGRVVVPETYGPKFSISTSNAGAATGVSHTPEALSPYLTDLAGITLETPPGNSVNGPLWPALDPQSAPAEGSNVPVLADPTLATATIGFYSRLTTLSAAVERFGNGQGNAGNRLRAEVVADVNRAFVTTAVTAAGTALAFVTGSTAPAMIDHGIARVTTRAGQRPGLIVVNEDDYASVSDRAATSGADIGIPVLAFNGVALAIDNGVTAGSALVVAGNGWTAYRDELTLVSAPIITTGQLGYRASQFAGAKPEFDGAAVVVALAAA